MVLRLQDSIKLNIRQDRSPPSSTQKPPDVFWRFFTFTIVLDNVAQLSEQSQALEPGKWLVDKGRLWDSIAIGGIRFAFADDIPDSGQEHAANGDDGFPVSAVNHDAAATDTELGVIPGLNDSVGNLDKNRLQAGLARVTSYARPSAGRVFLCPPCPTNAFHSRSAPS